MDWVLGRAVTGRGKSLIIGQRGKLWPPGIRNMVNLSFLGRIPGQATMQGPQGRKQQRQAMASASTAPRFPSCHHNQNSHTASTANQQDSQRLTGDQKQDMSTMGPSPQLDPHAILTGSNPAITTTLCYAPTAPCNCKAVLSKFRGIGR